MKILVTGSTGFLGTYISKELGKSGITFDTISRSATLGSKYVSDLSKEIPNLSPDYTHIIHIAGKAHSYPNSEIEKNEFFNVNYKGTVNLVRSFKVMPETFIFISSIAVYQEQTNKLIYENSETKPTSVYGKSKLKAERFLKSWATANNCRLIILRLPLVIGENPKGNLEKMIAGIKRRTYVKIKNNLTQKSMVLAEDIAKVITVLVHMGEGVYNLSDGVHPTVKDLEFILEKKIGKKILVAVPKWFLKILAVLGDLLEKITRMHFPINSLKYEKLVTSIIVDDSKARTEINWNPSPVLLYLEKQLKI